MAFDFSYLLGSAQRALLDAVVPELRAVTIDFDEEQKLIIVHFFYDAEINDELFDLASVACVEIDPDPDYPYLCHFGGDVAIQWNFPKKIPIRGRLIYLRKEPMYPEYKQQRASKLWPQSIPVVAVLLDMQEALLGKVTPALRRVTLDIDPDKKLLQFFFCYDGEISREDFDLASSAATEASCSYPDYSIEKHIYRVDYPERPPVRGERVAYSRKEVIL